MNPAPAKDPTCSQRFASCWNRKIHDKLVGPTLKFPPRRPKPPAYHTEQLSANRKVRKEAATKLFVEKMEAEGKEAKAAESARVKDWASGGKYHGHDGPGAYPEAFAKVRRANRELEAQREDLKMAVQRQLLMDELFDQRRDLEEVQWSIQYTVEHKEDRQAVPKHDLGKELEREATLCERIVRIERKLEEFRS